jgi:hypothetical protein
MFYNLETRNRLTYKIKVRGQVLREKETEKGVIANLTDKLIMLSNQVDMIEKIK